MEKKVIRNYKLLGMYSFLGYFVGTTVFVMLGGQNDLFHAIFGFGGALLLAVLFDAFQNIRNPKLKSRAEELVKDERLTLIEGKSASYTLNFIYLVLIIGVITGIYLNHDWIRYTCAGIYLLVYVVNRILYAYFNKKM